MLAVGRRGRRGVAVLRVALDFGSAARRFAGPEHLAVPPVDRVGEPDIGRAVGAAVDPAVGPVTEDRVGIVADRRGEEDPVTPDDRAGMPEPRDLRAPQDIVSGLGRSRRSGGFCPSGDAGGPRGRGTTASGTAPPASWDAAPGADAASSRAAPQERAIGRQRIGGASTDRPLSDGPLSPRPGPAGGGAGEHPACRSGGGRFWRIRRL